VGLKSKRSSPETPGVLVALAIIKVIKIIPVYRDVFPFQSIGLLSKYFLRSPVCIYIRVGDTCMTQLLLISGFVNGATIPQHPFPAIKHHGWLSMALQLHGQLQFHAACLRLGSISIQWV